MKTIHYAHFLMVLTIIAALSCARQTAPTGGPKDSIPPTPRETLPRNQQTNFKGQQIEATFSEAILLNNPKDQIIISPGVGKDFQATARKNKVIITLNNPLLPNTTYTVNFRDAVQDITEKNPAQNLYLAFSTGSYIDSLHLHGTAYEILSGKEGKDATVALYESDTFNIFAHKPAYFTKADAVGNFHIDNLKPGTYHVYAWLDNNKNLLVDSKTEAYGFIPNAAHPQDSTGALTLPLVRLDARPLKLTSARPTQTFFNIKTSKNTNYFSIYSNTQNIYASYGDDHENIRVYKTFPLEPTDSIRITFLATDSLQQSIDTTLYVKFAQRDIKPLPFQFSTDPASISAQTGVLHAILHFNKPISQVNHDSIFYRIDTAQLVPITPADISFDTTRTELTIRKSINRSLLQPKQNTTEPSTKQGNIPQPAPPSGNAQPPSKSSRKTPNNNELYIARASFISVENDTSKAAALQLKPTTMETTGVIIVELKTTQHPLLVQLLAKNKVLQTVSATNKATFSDLLPGDYNVRVIVDTDNNKTWTPGNILRNQPPEPIYYYRNEQGLFTITLKANWERELLITF